MAGRGHVRGPHSGFLLGSAKGPVPAQTWHKESRPAPVPPLDGRGLPPPRVLPRPSVTPPSLSGAASSLGWGQGRGRQDRAARDHLAQVPPSSGHHGLHHRALPPSSSTSTLPTPLISSPGVGGGSGVPHRGHPGSACPTSPHNTTPSPPPPSFPSAPQVPGPAATSAGTAEGSQAGSQGLRPSPRPLAGIPR